MLTDVVEHPAPLDAETSRKLLRLADDLPATWNALRGQGVSLFDLVVSHIEQMRPRPIDERPYPDYLSEVLKERLGFHYTLWTLGTRHANPRAVYRSAYLDHLQAKKDAGEYSFLAENPGNLIDANYALYVALKLADNARWMGFIAAYKAQMKVEAQSMEERIRALSAEPCKPTPTRIARLLENITEPIGFETVLRDVKRGRLVYRRVLDEKMALYLEHDDHRGGRGGSLVFVFQPPEFPVWERLEKSVHTAPLVLSADSFLPEGRWYLHFRDDWNSIVLGCLVNGQLLGLLADRWGELA